MSSGHQNITTMICTITPECGGVLYNSVRIQGHNLINEWKNIFRELSKHPKFGYKDMFLYAWKYSIFVKSLYMRPTDSSRALTSQDKDVRGAFVYLHIIIMPLYLREPLYLEHEILYTSLLAF